MWASSRWDFLKKSWLRSLGYQCLRTSKYILVGFDDANLYITFNHPLGPIYKWISHQGPAIFSWMLNNSNLPHTSLKKSPISPHWQESFTFFLFVKFMKARPRHSSSLLSGPTHCQNYSLSKGILKRNVAIPAISGLSKPFALFCWSDALWFLIPEQKLLWCFTLYNDINFFNTTKNWHLEWKGSPP